MSANQISVSSGFPGKICLILEGCCSGTQVTCSNDCNVHVRLIGIFLF